MHSKRIPIAYNGIDIDEDTKMDMAKVLCFLQRIHQKPLNADECMILFNALVEIQFEFSQEVEDFQGVLEAILMYAELVEKRLANSQSSGQNTNKGRKGGYYE